LKPGSKRLKTALIFPKLSELLDVLRSFTLEEWLLLSDLVLVDGLTEAEEEKFLQPRLEEHLTRLCEVLRQPPRRDNAVMRVYLFSGCLHSSVR